jgi:hypothetical protein
MAEHDLIDPVSRYPEAVHAARTASGDLRDPE